MSVCSHQFCILLLACLLLLQSGCSFMPRMEHAPEDDECLLLMPSWELDMQAVENIHTCQSGDPRVELGCLAFVGVILPVGSLVVSGSVVLVGNTLRWIEYQGRCDESYLNQALDHLGNTLSF